MYGGIRVTKQNSIFNLIRNGTLDDLKKLIEIAPEKLNNKEGRYNPVDWAIKYEKNDMVAFLKTKGLEETDTANAYIYMNIIKNISNNKSLDELKNIYNDKDLSFIYQDEKMNIYNRLVATNYLRDEKIDELTKQKLFDNLNEEASVKILFDNINQDLSIFKIGLKNGSKSNKENFGRRILAHTIKHCHLPDALERIQLLIDNGADVKYKPSENVTYFNYLYEGKKPVEFYKVFVDAGLDIDSKISYMGYSILFIGIIKKDKALFDYIITNGANLDLKVTDGQTPLMVASSIQDDIYYVKELITHGADVNAVSNENGTALMYSIKAAKKAEHLQIIKYLLDHGADKTIKTNHDRPKTAIDLAQNGYKTNPELYKKILTLLGVEIKEELWKGSTRSDIEKYDIFFEKPFDYSCCPICLEYIERKEGCMYMSHNCAATNHYYHNKLYNTYAYGAYEGSPKKVEWCTVCGRVTKNHKHYILSLATNPSTTLAALDPEIQARLNANQNVVFFDNANCVGFGGGGTLEKAARFRRLREYTLELQEDVGKKEHTYVMNELIEEVFNAPLFRNRKLEKILQDKKWNINIEKFPENVRNARNNNANRNYANIVFEGVLPTVLPSKDHDCIIMGDDDEGKEENPVVHFHHETKGGINHDGIDICQKDLARAIQVANKEFGDERFGKCWFPQCQAILHPEEIKPHIPEVLYLEYKKKFNKKMAKAGGHRYTRKTNKTRKYKGGNKNNSKQESVLHKLDFSDVTCALPNFTKDGKLRKN